MTHLFARVMKISLLKPLKRVGRIGYCPHCSSFLSLFFCFPLLKDLYTSGSGDWDYFMFLYEVPSIALFEYGQFPLWNPYCGGGISLIGNPQAGYLSPIFIFTALFGVAAGLKIAVLVHTFLGKPSNRAEDQRPKTLQDRV